MSLPPVNLSMAVSLAPHETPVSTFLRVSLPLPRIPFLLPAPEFGISYRVIKKILPFFYKEAIQQIRIFEVMNKLESCNSIPNFPFADFLCYVGDYTQGRNRLRKNIRMTFSTNQNGTSRPSLNKACVLGLPPRG